MPLESATYITDLNESYPAITDDTGQGDDHLRLIKLALKTTLPNFNAALASTPAEIDAVAHTGSLEAEAGSSVAPSINFGKASDATTGLYRASAGHIGIAGRLTGNGAVPVGSKHEFPKEPSSLGKGGNNTGGPFEYLEADGSLWNVADYPDLGAFYGSTFGGDGTNTFGVPNFTDHGRFSRSRSTAFSIVEGTARSHNVGPHDHTGTTSTVGNHTHGATSTPSLSGGAPAVTINDPWHVHAMSSAHYYVGTTHAGYGAPGSVDIPVGPVADMLSLSVLAHATGTSATAGGVTISGSVGTTIVAAGSHDHTFTTDNGSGAGTENRPYDFAVVVAIKT